MKISQELIKILSRYWQDGRISRHAISTKHKIQLKRLGLIKYSDKGYSYDIQRDVYNKMMKENQETLC